MGCRLMRNFSPIRIFALSTLTGLASLTITGAQAFDRSSSLSFANPNVQQASLPTDFLRDVRSTRALVDDPTGARVGTITIDTKNCYLYLSMQGGKAMRYSAGVGREGFAWS